MAPRHTEMCDRNRMAEFDDHEPSFSPFEEHDFDDSEVPFDPFEHSAEFDEDYDDSFGNDFSDSFFPEDTAPAAAPSSNGKSPKSPRQSSRKPRRRLDDSSKGLHDSDCSTGRKRLGDASLNDSSRPGIGDSSRRRRSTRDRTPKPEGRPHFPVNTRRTSLNNGKSRAGAPKRSSAPPLSPRADRDRAARPPSGAHSRSRRGLLDESSHTANGMPLSPGSSRRSSGGKERSSPRSKRDSLMSSSRRDSTGKSDARTRIRKAAALQREREMRDQEEAKISRQKEKLARQKDRTNEMLGRKLAKLDEKNGDTGMETTEEDSKSMGSRTRRELNGSTHGPGGNQRRRRRTHLSHNILVRNMNQMTAPRLDQDQDMTEGEYEDGKVSQDLDDMHMSSHGSVADSVAKKEAWQRRLERQRL